MSETGIISKYESGVDLIFEWKIEHFFNLPKSEYWSPCISFRGVQWHLMIIPNEIYRRDSAGYVSLGLKKFRSIHPIKQLFSFSLKTLEGKKYNEEHCTKHFKNTHPENHHLSYRFILRSELKTRRFDLVPKNVLTVVCTIKSWRSAESESTGFSQPQGWNPRGIYAGDYRSPGYGYNRTFYINYDHGQSGNYCGTSGYAWNDPEHANVGISTQPVRASTQRGRTSTQRVRTSAQCVRASTQTVEVYVQTVEEKCETSASGSPICSHDDELHHDFRNLFLNKEDCDIIIKVKDSEFPAHRLILKARSPVFFSNFRHDMKDNAIGIVKIEDCNPSTFSDFLCYLYCGDVTLISRENVFGLFTAADKYQVSTLRTKCLEFVKENLSVDTFCETITLALRHSEAELIKLCTDYFKQNVPKIIVTVKWQIFLAENPTESNELLIKSFVPNSS